MSGAGELLQPQPWRIAARRARRRRHGMAQPLERRKIDEGGDRRAQRRELPERIERHQTQRVRVGEAGHTPELANAAGQRSAGVVLSRLVHRRLSGARLRGFQELQMREHLAHRELADLLRRPAEGLRQPERRLRQRIFDGAGDLFL